MSKKLRALDLFCGGGGASVGLANAGFEVHGVDIVKQPRYPFTFTQGSAIDAALDGYDFVWASPPCQAHTALRGRTKRDYECFIVRTRDKLLKWGGPFVIENVIGAPLRPDLMLCGASFGLRSYRHRLFECSFPVQPLPHREHVIRVNRRGENRQEWYAAGGFLTVTGDIGRYAGPGTMGIDWMNGNELSQAIPPAYAEYIARQFLKGRTL